MAKSNSHNPVNISVETELPELPGAKFTIDVTVPPGSTLTPEKVNQLIVDSQAKFRTGLRYAKVLKALGIAVEEL